MTTRLGHISELQPVKFDVSMYDNPIRPELFQGISEARPGKDTGLTQFGVNYVVLETGSASALRHWHEGEDEFVLVLEGNPTLIDNHGEHPLVPGNFVGFPAGEANAHHFINGAESPAVLLIMGSRRPGEDTCHYPDDDLGPVKR